MKRRPSSSHRLLVGVAGVGGCLLVGSCVLLWRRSQTTTSRLRTQTTHRRLPAWEEGWFDVHHIRAGSSESTFLRFPDGRTMLIDAGDTHEVWNEAYGGTLTRDEPDPRFQTSAAQIVDYLKHFGAKKLDVVAITHFHSDHIGSNWPDRPTRRTKDGRRYVVFGVAEVREHFEFGMFLDRGYPTYDSPTPLAGTSGTFDNYKTFVDDLATRGRTRVERVELANDSSAQITNQSSPQNEFRVRVLKRGLETVDNAHLYEPSDVLSPDGQKTWDENLMSVAFVFEYGDFKYFEGGDNQHVEFGEVAHKKTGVDTTTPVARLVGGPVDVATLNHHSHGVNFAFLDLLQPKVAILQSWCSDQPTDEALALLTDPALPVLDGSRDRLLFATALQPESFASRGPRLRKFTSIHGHVVLRVYPPPQASSSDDPADHQRYKIYVLDADLHVVSKHGPFVASAGGNSSKQEQGRRRGRREDVAAPAASG